MTLASSIKQFVENIMVAARIVSPRFADYKVDGFDFYSESGQFDETFRADVVNIIQEEIKIQLTEVKQSGVESSSPIGSVDSQIKSNVLKGISLAKNPMSAVSAALSKAPIPQAALVALAMALIPMIISVLTKDGSALDLRWKRLMQKEENSFLDRQTQRNTQIGLRQVIIQSRAGFIQVNGAGASEDNIRQIRDGGVDGNRLARTGLVDHSKGLFGP